MFQPRWFSSLCLLCLAVVFCIHESCLFLPKNFCRDPVVRTTRVKSRRLFFSSSSSSFFFPRRPLSAGAITLALRLGSRTLGRCGMGFPRPVRTNRRRDDFDPFCPLRFRRRRQSPLFLLLLLLLLLSFPWWWCFCGHGDECEYEYERVL